MNRMKLLSIIALSIPLIQSNYLFASLTEVGESTPTCSTTICKVPFAIASAMARLGSYFSHKVVATAQWLLENNQVNERDTVNEQAFLVPDEQPAVPVQDKQNEPIILSKIAETLQDLPELPKKPTGYIQAEVLAENARIIAIGDLHGDHTSFKINLMHLQEKGVISRNLKLQDNYHLVITGDLADRGSAGVDVWLTAMELMHKNYGKVHIIRGNHETFIMSARYGFLEELKRRFPGNDQLIWFSFNQLFRHLPHALFLGIRTDVTQPTQYIMYCHGGIEPRLDEQIKALLTQADHEKHALCTFQLADFNNGECALNWGDFHATDYTEADIQPTSRNIEDVYSYNRQFVSNYLHSFDTSEHFIQCIIRGHQHNPGGVTQLKEQDPDDSSFEPMEHLTAEQIKQGSVFNLISSPDGLGNMCKEDSYAIVKKKADGLQLRPYIWPRW